MYNINIYGIILTYYVNKLGGIILKASLITLGCNKNEIDSEMIVSYVSGRGFEITDNLSEAALIIINTCGFINSAKEEAISTILNVVGYKYKGTCKHIFVVGCLAKRYKKEIYKEFPEVDLVIGVDEYSEFDTIFSKYFKLNDSKLSLNFHDREVSSLFPMAYLRISDGCNNRCHYCAIPLIRGNLKSRKIEDIVLEAKNLVARGIKELCIISQDTTSYGLDIYGKCELRKLIQELSKIEDLKWIRVLYMYPGKISDDLLQEFLENNKLCRYFDIPVQHISDKILKLMNRHTTKQEIYDVVNKIREKMPDSIIRTTVMVGYQQETEKDFEELKQGIKDLKFDRLGAFTFSKEDDTVASRLDGDIDENIKEARYNEIMQLQQDIISEKMKKLIGKEFEVVVENVTEDNKYFICRSYMDAPDVDPRIYLELEENIDKVIVGEYYNVILTEIKGYDFIAKLK